MRTPRCFTHALCEPLEARTFLSAAVTTQADSDISALFGGSILFARSDGGTNRLHATVNVDAAASDGSISGRVNIDGLGKFQFTGSDTNDIVFLVFTGAAGSGTLVASHAGDGSISGELMGMIDGVQTQGAVRLHSDGGSPASDMVTQSLASATTSSTGATTAASSLAGTYSGTVQFHGTTLAPASSGTQRSDVHAVLHLDDSGSGLLGSTFSMDRIGSYDITGATVGDQIVLIFDGGTGSGALVLRPSASLGGIDNQSGLLVPGLTGKLYATIGGMDLHANVRLHNTAATLLAQVGGEGTPETINVGGNTFGNTAITNPGTDIGSPVDNGTGSNGIDINTGISAIGGTPGGISTVATDNSLNMIDSTTIAGQETSLIDQEIPMIDTIGMTSAASSMFADTSIIG